MRKTGFKVCPFKFDLYSYSAVPDAVQYLQTTP
jgi:hypothetical protein